MKRLLCVTLSSFMMLSLLSYREPAHAQVRSTENPSYSINTISNDATASDGAEMTIDLKIWALPDTLATIQRDGIYTGDLNNNIPHGYGQFKTTDLYCAEWVYTGEFKDGLFHGEGEIVWPNLGVSEKGTYENGLFIPTLSH